MEHVSYGTELLKDEEVYHGVRMRDPVDYLRNEPVSTRPRQMSLFIHSC